jgi:hypothetical protein
MLSFKSITGMHAPCFSAFLKVESISSFVTVGLAAS